MDLISSVGVKGTQSNVKFKFLQTQACKIANHSVVIKHPNMLGKPAVQACVFTVLGARANQRNVSTNSFTRPAGDHDGTVTERSAGDTLDKSRRHDFSLSLLL